MDIVLCARSQASKLTGNDPHEGQVMSATSYGGSPPIFRLPDGILRQIATILDVPAVHNWKYLSSLVPGYTHTELRAMRIEEQYGRSPGMALLRDLHTRGWTVNDLAILARQAHLEVIVDTIKEYCQKAGITLQLHDTNIHLPSISKYPKSAQTCYDRPAHPLPPAPPQQGVEASPPFDVGYQTLLMATGHFSQIPYKEGGHKLGEGGFGEVFYCRLFVGGRENEIAVKMLKVYPPPQGDSSTTSVDKKQFLTELQTLSLLSHECILDIIGYSHDGPSLCILYPFMRLGSLDRLITDKDTLPPSRRVSVACDVARALQYLHCSCERVVVHRDVKSANVLLMESWQAKLGDFGVVRFLPSAQTTMTTRVVGTLVYMAPEYTKGMITPAADVYAFGVVLYELATGLSAQDDVDDEGTDLLSYIEDYEDDPADILIGQWPGEVCQGVWSLAGQCVEHNRKKRPTASKLVQDLATYKDLMTAT